MDTHEVVSSEAEELILVDANDAELGYLSKAQCHDGAGQLHRAFSVFLFNDTGELLLQQRSQSKRLWPGYWSNTCCSHPRRGETMQVATERRLLDELRVTSTLQFVYKFEYQAAFGEFGSENELCHVYLGRIAGSVTPNANEVDAIRYLSAAALDNELDNLPNEFTPWFKLEWQALKTDYHDQLRSFTHT